MYAITFDLDTNVLEQTYGGASWRNGYNEIRTELRTFGFDWQQGSVCFGNDSVTPVTCVLAVMSLTRKLKWFSASVRDIRMLRIEENNDLKPAIDDAAANA